MKKSLLKVTALALGLTSVLGVSLALVNNASRTTIKANAADETYTFDVPTYASANSWANGVAQTSVTAGGFTFTVSGGGNNGKYYTSDTTWRFYNGGGLSVKSSDGYTITSVTSDASVTFAASGSSFAASFTATTKIKSITIKYSSGSGSGGGSGEVSSATTFDLTKNETTSASADQLKWYKAPVGMEFNKGGSSTPANNYYPGTSGKTYSSTRAYNGFNMKFVADSGYVITGIELTSGSDAYATACVGNTWKNATAAADGNVVTVTPSGDYSEITCAVGATQGFTKVIVTYKAGSAVTPEEPVETISSIQEVYEAALAGSTSEYTFIGTVAAMAGNSFYLQQNGYGFLVYNRAVTGIAIGKKVKVTATVQKYSGLCETKVISSAELVEGEGETITPVQFADAASFLASNHDILGSASGLTSIVQQTASSSTSTGKYTANFGGTTITFTVDKFAYTAAIGEKITSILGASFESLDIVGAPIGNYNSVNQFVITSADQLVVHERSVYVSSVSLNKTSLSLTAGGTGDTLVASVTMSDSSAYTGAIEWTSSDSTVATVANGVVTPVNAGTATITAKAGNETATCSVTVSEAAGVTYTKLSQYDFAEYASDYGYSGEFVATETDGKQTLKEAFENAYISSTTSDIVSSVSNVSKVYGGQTDYFEKGIKLGTSGANGTFSVTTTEEVDKVVIETYSWTATDTLAVGGITKTPGVVYSSTTDAVTLNYTFDSSKTNIDFVYAKRGYIKSVTFYSKDATTPDPEPTDSFSIVAPEEIDFLSENNAFTYENLPENNNGVCAWLTVDADSNSTNFPANSEVSGETTETPSIYTVETTNTSFYIQAYYLNATYQPVYATPVKVDVNYGLSNFVDDFEEVRTDCNNGVNPNVASITETWDVLALCWEDLSSTEQATFKATVANGAAATTTLENTTALYDLLVAKYNLTNFASRTVSSMSRGLMSITKDTATATAIVAVAAISSISLVGALAVSKKRKEN